MCFSSNKIESKSPFVEETKTDKDIDLRLNFYLANVSAATNLRSKGVSSDHLTKIWSIDKEAAERTINYTTQLRKHDTDGGLSRHFSTNDQMLRYKRIDSVLFTDTFHAKGGCTSACGYKHCQLFVSDKGFIFVVLMKKKY